MTQATPSARHARLFELIRQQNLAASACLDKPQGETALHEAQSFLQAAQQSLHAAE